MTDPPPVDPFVPGLLAGGPSGIARPVRFAGIGACSPKRVMSNHDLERMVETNDEWIRTRTGIRERRIAADEEASSDLALVAARRALESARIQAGDLDLIIVPTSTPDMVFPATASLLQNRLGAARAGAFDLSAACTGFIYAAAAASAFVRSGISNTVLVAAAECMSRILDWTDRSTCVLFGDGAGAVVLQPGDETSHILGIDLGSDGSGADLLQVPGSGSRCFPGEPAPVRPFIRMAGGEVYKFAVRVMQDSSLAVLRKCGLATADLDWFVPHQANIRIIDAAVKRLEISPDKVVTNVDRYGNTSAASIPLALAELHESGRLKKGDLVLMVGFGAGLSWGSVLLRW